MEKEQFLLTEAMKDVEAALAAMRIQHNEIAITYLRMALDQLSEAGVSDGT